MTSDVQVERRLTAVEQAVAELRQQLALVSPAPDWLERLKSSLKDEPEFDKVLEYGREIRRSDRPPEDPGDQV